jgi:hypothetical protein
LLKNKIDQIKKEQEELEEKRKQAEALLRQRTELVNKNFNQ